MTGACCGFGACHTFFGRTQCKGSGVYLGEGTSCSPNRCASVTGACCMSGVGCFDRVAPMVCSGGYQAVYAGDGTACGDSPAPCEVGACCLAPGSCKELLIRPECTDLNGTFSPGVLCAATGC